MEQLILFKNTHVILNIDSLPETHFPCEVLELNMGDLADSSRTGSRVEE